MKIFNLSSFKILQNFVRLKFNSNPTCPKFQDFLTEIFAYELQKIKLESKSFLITYYYIIDYIQENPNLFKPKLVQIAELLNSADSRNLIMNVTCCPK